MREPVLNSVSVGLGIECLVDALEATADLELGLIALVSSNHLQRQIRLHAPPNEIEVTNGITLYEVFQELCRRTPDRGRFLMRMVMKFPIEDNVTDEELETLIDWRVRDYPDSLSLVLCAMSEAKIAVSLTRDDGWTVSPLNLTLIREAEKKELTVEKSIPNLYSLCNARELAGLFDQSLLNTIDPVALWNQREVLFPSLRFGPRVGSDLQRVEPQVYRAALGRLFELNLAAVEWSSGDHPVPRYLSKVTGESTATMDKYGHERVFQSASGTQEMFEKHARLPDGHRLHLRELFARRQLEIGYIGRHLSIVSRN